MKRKISKKDYRWLASEIDSYVTEGHIENSQAESIKELYEIKQGLSFVRVLLVLGAVLVGLGVLSFIASNWQYLGKIAKLVIIFISYVIANGVSYRFYESNHRVAQAFLYIGVFIYGAGIFLIGQMFNFGGHFTGAFLLWALGLIPTVYLLKEKLIFFFVNILSLVYILGYLDIDQLPWLGLGLVPGLYYLNKIFEYDSIGIFFNNLVALSLLVSVSAYFDLRELYIALIFFALGITGMMSPLTRNKKVFQIQGTILMGVSGLILTFPYLWDFIKVTNINIGFAVFYLLLLLLLIRGGNLVALAFFCLTIFRFYVDTFYDFMPKSAFFLLGGIMLLGFGWYFENRRRKQGGIGFE